MNRAPRLAAGVWLAVAAWQAVADEAPVKATVTVLVTPPAVQPGEAVTVSGIAPLDAKGAVTVRISPPGGKPPVDLRVNPSANGDYSANFRGTAVAGDYKVGVTSPGGRISGQGAFTVAVMEPLNDIEEAIQQVKRIEAAIQDISADLDAQIPKLPDNPARDQLKAKWAVLKPKLAQAARELADIKGLLEPLASAARQDPALKPALAPIAKKLDDWNTYALPERERIVQELRRSRGKNVTCESLERITEGFNFASALLNLMGGPVAAVKSVFADFLASKVAAVGDKLSKQFGFSAAETSKIVTAVGLAKAKGVWDGEKVVAKAAAKEAMVGSVAGLLSDAMAFASSQIFARYCERMAGPFQGTMHAEFFSTKGGKKWWSYDINYSGRLDLRYAKTTAVGQAVAVNGEFMGQATKFTLWEDAIRIGWPDLTAGALMFKRALLPQPQLINRIMGAPVGSEEKPIDVEGKAAATFAKPYTFFVPVEGEIVNNVLTLRMKPATSDYTAVARVVYVIVSPLTFVPVATAFELPYKEGNFFFTRVSNEAPMRFQVVKQGNALKVDGSAKNAKGNAIAKGRYDLKIQLCNPEGSC
jgi:hypothetical protein